MASMAIDQEEQTFFVFLFFFSVEDSS